MKFLVAILALLVSGCCMKSISLKPELSAADVKTLGVGNADVDVNFTLKDCCPTKAQKSLALDIQTQEAALYAKVVSGAVPLADYNNLVKAANDAIMSALICTAKPSPTVEGDLTRARDALHRIKMRLGF